MSYTGNGVSKDFAFPFTILKSDDLVVLLDDVPQAVGIQFTIDGIGDQQGGTVSFVAAPLLGARITLYREVAIEREDDYQDNGDLLAKTLNGDFDRIWMAIQDGGFGLTRAVRVPRSDVNPSMTLPGSALRANKALGFDANGDPFMIDLKVGSIAAPVVSNVAMLRMIDWSTTFSAFALGHTTPGDDGGGQYFPDYGDDSSNDNDATVIVANDGTRVKLQVLLYVTTGQFGARRDSTGINSTGTDDSNAFANALQWVCDHNRAYKLIASPGVHRLTRTMLPSAPYMLSGTSVAPKNVGENAIGGGSWLYYDHTGKGISTINSGATSRASISSSSARFEISRRLRQGGRRTTTISISTRNASTTFSIATCCYSIQRRAST
ncbi:hypothetical protein [Burkholderia cenocepacia]|uniref:hypothetical protein n=1 Tax=Burkholderia cenocepacia TaxID=95486 RepID=UPI00163D2629|nr:hypothetical protein [Burkholderia cenocepacia]